MWPNFFYLRRSTFRFQIFFFPIILIVSVRFQGALLVVAIHKNPARLCFHGKKLLATKVSRTCWNTTLYLKMQTCVLKKPMPWRARPVPSHLSPKFWLTHFRQVHLAYAPVMNDSACWPSTVTINHLNNYDLKYNTAFTFHRLMVSTELYERPLV